MSETVITVQGRFSAFYPPERATVWVAAHLQGRSRDAAFAATNACAELIRGRIADAFDPASGPITWWSSDNVQVWTEKPWNSNGVQLDPVFHSRIGFTAKFSDFVHLAHLVEDLAVIPGVSVGEIEWALTEASRSAVVAEVRSRAVKDAVAKAAVYAQSIGLGTVRAIALADQGMLSDLAGGTGFGSSEAKAMSLRGAAVESGPELSLKPEDIEVKAAVDARFVAT